MTHFAFAPLAALTTGVGLMLARIATDVGLLAPKRPRRRCPSCGRLADRRGCDWCRQ
jgi:hypothetical protein